MSPISTRRRGDGEHRYPDHAAEDQVSRFSLGVIDTLLIDELRRNYQGDDDDEKNQALTRELSGDLPARRPFREPILAVRRTYRAENTFSRLLLLTADHRWPIRLPDSPPVSRMIPVNRPEAGEVKTTILYGGDLESPSAAAPFEKAAGIFARLASRLARWWEES